jgi:hypothetical protein
MVESRATYDTVKEREGYHVRIELIKRQKQRCSCVSAKRDAIRGGWRGDQNEKIKEFITYYKT